MFNKPFFIKDFSRKFVDRSDSFTIIQKIINSTNSLNELDKIINFTKSISINQKNEIIKRSIDQCKLNAIKSLHKIIIL